MESIAALAARLGVADGDIGWLDETATLVPADGLELPDDAVAEVELVRLGVGISDRSEMLAARPSRVRSPDLWWLLERVHRQLADGVGDVGAELTWPDLGPEHGLTGAYLYAWALLAALPHVRAFHRDRGVPDDVSWASLSDFGRQVRRCRSLSGHGGLTRAGWLSFHFRGVLYELGRLQFQRIKIPVDQVRMVFREAVDELPALSIHIPAGTSMSPGACDASLASAAEFFGRHFPDEDHQHVVCHSWLLDPQLGDYLPHDSNIMQFQRRFEPVPALEPEPDEHDDDFVLELVFGRSASGRADKLLGLPQDTTLQRALVGHIRAGGHWYFRNGWARLR